MDGVHGLVAHHVPSNESALHVDASDMSTLAQRHSDAS